MVLADTDDGQRFGICIPMESNEKERRRCAGRQQSHLTISSAVARSDTETLKSL